MSHDRIDELLGDVVYSLNKLGVNNADVSQGAIELLVFELCKKMDRLTNAVAGVECAIRGEARS